MPAAVLPLTLHCRQCAITSVEINGVPTGEYEHLDPHNGLVFGPGNTALSSVNVENMPVLVGSRSSNP